MRTFNLFGSEICVLPPAIQHTIEGMGGRSPVFVMRKNLTRTDAAPHQSRLLITNGEVLWGLLSDDEKMKVRAEGYDIEVVDPRGERHEMKLKVWESWNSWNSKLVLNCGWIKLVRDNQLEAEMDCIELCSFRMGSKLCFALDVERSQDHP